MTSRLSFVPSVNNMSHQRLHDSDENNSSDDDENSPLTQDLYGGRYLTFFFLNIYYNVVSLKQIGLMI